MREILNIAVFTVAVSMVYTAVAQVLPQLPNHPPANVEMGSNIGSDALAEAGAGIFESNCTQCHKAGETGRAPDVSSVGSTAHARAAERSAATGEAYSDIDYLLESLCKPYDYLVEGYGRVMPPQQKALSGGQLLALVAYLQNLGGEATVKGTDVDPVLRFGCSSAGGAAPAAEASAKKMSAGPPEKVFKDYGCATCHSIDSDEAKSGPSLMTVGARLTTGQLYEAIIAPDASMATGFESNKGLMGGSLKDNGFYDTMTPADYQALVDWLAEKKG
jgi:cytochrome c2